MGNYCLFLRSGALFPAKFVCSNLFDWLELLTSAPLNNFRCPFNPFFSQMKCVKHIIACSRLPSSFLLGGNLARTGLQVVLAGWELFVSHLYIQRPVQSDGYIRAKKKIKKKKVKSHVSLLLHILLHACREFGRRQSWMYQKGSIPVSSRNSYRLTYSRLTGGNLS